jgi:hypothetical protein
VKFSKRLEAEIDDRVAMRGNTREEAVLDLLMECDDREMVAWDFRYELRDYGIKIGVFREITPGEIERTVVSSGKAWDFKRNGKYYVFDSWTPLTGE